MKADWDKLGGEFANSPNVMIVDVDCTADDGKATCAKYQVQGYPTIKYFLAGTGKGKSYKGARDLSSLKQFAKSTLDKSQCNLVTGEDCEPNQQKFIEKNKDKTVAELDEILAERKAEFKKTKAEFSAVKKEFTATEKAFKKKEKREKTAKEILKALKKVAPTAPVEAAPEEAAPVEDKNEL